MTDRAMVQARALADPGLAGADAERPHPPKYGNRHHLTMLRIYGENEGRKCRGCAHLVRLAYNHTVLKCGKTAWTRSEATDWRAGWQACGAFEEAQKGNG